MRKRIREVIDWFWTYLKKLIVWIWKYLRKILKFIISKFFLKLLGACIITISIIFNEIISSEDYPIFKIVLAIILGSLFLFFDLISNKIATVRERKKKQVEIENQLKPVIKFLRKKASINIEVRKFTKLIEISDIDYSKREPVLVFVVNHIENKTQIEKDAIILSALCYEVDSEINILHAERYKSVITTIFEKYDFIGLDEGAKTIIDYYQNYTKDEKLSTPVSNIDYIKKTEELTAKYSKTFNLSFKLKLEKRQSEEFRRTLSILIRDGKLSVKQLENELKDRIGAELQKKAISSKAFLVLSNIFQRIPEVENVLNRFPHVKYSFPNPSRLPDNIKYISTRIIFPSSTFQDAKEFLQNEIRPLIPDERINDGFIAIIPIEGTELYSIPENSDDITKSHLKDGFESVTAYKTGVSFDMTELYLETMQDDINVDEVLANIPFNIFVPNLSEKIKNFLISKYEELKSKFNITRLSDWANINIDDLKVFLVELDIKRDKQRLHTDEKWEKVAKKIIEQAIKHRDALNN
jgi:hypothetical protein